MPEQHDDAAHALMLRSGSVHDLKSGGDGQGVRTATSGAAMADPFPLGPGPMRGLDLPGLSPAWAASRATSPQPTPSSAASSAPMAWWLFGGNEGAAISAGENTSYWSGGEGARKKAVDEDEAEDEGKG